MTPELEEVYAKATASGIKKIPFKLPLKSSVYTGVFTGSEQVGDTQCLYSVGEAHGETDEIQDARRDHIILCVNAFPNLVAICQEYAAMSGRVSRGMGSENLEVAAQEARDFLHEIGEDDETHNEKGA